MNACRLTALVVLGACGAPERSAVDYADDPVAATETIAACDEGRARRDCNAAEHGLAEARRRGRLDAYRRSF